MNQSAPAPTEVEYEWDFTFDAEHFMFAFIIFLLMWLHASNYWGIGRWWRAKTPAFLH